MIGPCARLYRRLARAVFGAGAVALSMATAEPAWAWQTAHGRPDNGGFADVETAPAANPLPNAPRLGGVAPGAGPVIAPDGTVYVVNGRGNVMSFRPDGTPGWSRDIGSQGVLSSPALGSDGAIYVIGAATIRDHTTSPSTTKQVAELHKFNAGGAYLWHVPLPGAAGRLTTSAPPNIWRAGGVDVVMVPTIRKFGGFEARLTAFSSDTGAVLATQIVTSFVPETTGGSDLEWWELPCAILTLGLCDFGFDSPKGPAPDPVNLLPEKLPIPFPAVAIFTPAGNGVPLVMMSDGFRDLVGYFFNGKAFEERFRVRDDKRVLLSTPLAWPDGHAMISTGGRLPDSDVMFAGLNMSTIRAAGPISLAAPTQLGNSRFAIVHRSGGVTFLRGATTETTVGLPGHSIASAAASRNHVFVSTASALHTFDKATMRGVAKLDWTRGGVSPPAIGPQGHVYAIADDRLFVFPPTPNLPVSQFDAWASAPNARAISGDFNGDGRADIALAGGQGWTTIPVAFSQGDGTFSVTNAGRSDFAGWASAPGAQVVAGDVNGDGRDDLIATGGSGWWTIPVAFSNGDGTFGVSNQPNSPMPVWAQAEGVKVLSGDVNGDGRSDLILTGGSGWRTIPVGFSNGDGTFRVTNRALDKFPTWAQDPYAKASATDVNGDGRADIVLAGGSKWTTVPMAFSRGDNGFWRNNRVEPNMSTWSQGVGAKLLSGDFNGDHRGDIVLTGGAGWSTIPVGFSKGDGTLSVSNAAVSEFPTWAQDPGAKAVSGDFDGDGRADLALVGGAGWWTLPVAFSNGNGTFRVTNFPID